MWLFRRTRRGYQCRLDREYAAVVRSFAREAQRLLDAAPPPAPAGDADDELTAMVGIAGEAAPRSDDPVLARLFPDAYDDPEAATEYRRYAYADLHAEKRARLERLCVTLAEQAPHIVLDDEDAQVWLAALNDLRLMLATRLGVTEDNHGELLRLPDDDPRRVTYQFYGLLSELQESLVEAVAGW